MDHPSFKFFRRAPEESGDWMPGRSAGHPSTTLLTPSSGRISVEAIVGISVAVVALLLFGMTFVTRGERRDDRTAGGGQPTDFRAQEAEDEGRTPPRSRPHEAMEFAPATEQAGVKVVAARESQPARTGASARDVNDQGGDQKVAVADAADNPSSSGPADDGMAVSSAAGETITRDGVTVLTPELLVPVVNLGEYLELRADPDVSKDAETKPARRNSSPVTKKHRRSTSRIHLRRHTELRIVGLAAARKRVVVSR